MSSQAKYTNNPQARQLTFNPLPAVVLGGPPHSGKSVLAYSLTQALRQQQVDHYVVRAYPPDYEGDWFLDVPQAWVRHLRIKGKHNDVWLPLLQRDIARRHLPLIVDVGGRPTLEQEALLDECTHGVLLTPDAESHALWAEQMARHGLVVLADLHSELVGDTAISTTVPVLKGTLTGLERGAMASGPVFAALLQQLTALFTPFIQNLPHQHLENAPVELTVDLTTLARHFRIAAHHWQPENLPAVLDYLPDGKPLGLYGRGPNWLYAAVAAHTRPAPFYLFDVRLGWVEAPHIQEGESPAISPLHVQRKTHPAGILLDLQLEDTYLDITEVEQLRVPYTAEQGLIFSGKLPHWLYTALVHTSHAPWVAVFQPQVQGAVVVAVSEKQSAPQSAQIQVGQVLPMTAR